MKIYRSTTYSQLRKDVVSNKTNELFGMDLVQMADFENEYHKKVKIQQINEAIN